jgi:hypothetical protein
MNHTDLLFQIAKGDFDPYVEEIIATCVARRKQKRDQEIHKFAATINVGDTVRMKNGRPQYLVGALAKVTKVMDKYVNMDLLVPVGRYGNDIRCPMSILEKVET